MKRIVSRAVAATCLSIGLSMPAAPARAALLTLGAPATTAPPALVDPLGTLPSALDPGLYLLPVAVADAAGLTTFAFDIAFDAAVVAPHDAGGLFQSVYAALFSAADPAPSEITGSGVALPGLLTGVSGFSPGVDGDGTLALVLFALTPGADIADAGFRIDAPVIGQVPTPGSAALAALPLLALLWRRRRQALGGLAVAAGCGAAAAQSTVTANGPYYATPSWNQTIAAGRFVVLSNFRSEAVLDRETGLVWQRAPSTSIRPHEGALSHCITQEIGGRLGWRTPTIDELSSLIDPAVPDPGPTLSPGHPFVLPAGLMYWSSTVLAISGQLGGMRAHFDGGFVSAALPDRLFHTWCVRGGSR